MSDTDNPAPRLALILERTSRAVPKDRALDSWMKIFDIGDKNDLPGRIALALSQLAEAREAIESLPEGEDPAHLLTHFPDVEKLFNDIVLQPGSAQMGHFIAQVKGEMIYSMQTCARALRRHGMREPTLDTEAINELLTLVRETIDEVLKSEFPEKVKIFMVKRLREVEEALIAVSIGGFGRVEAALDAFAFAGLKVTAHGSPERSRVGEWFGNLWGKIHTLAAGTGAITGVAADASEIFRAISS